MLLTLVLITLMVLVFTTVLLALTSVLKLHFDNYNYCRNELDAKCNSEDYKYCATIKR